MELLLENQPPSKGGGEANVGLVHFDYYPARNGVTLHRSESVAAACWTTSPNYAPSFGSWQRGACPLPAARWGLRSASLASGWRPWSIGPKCASLPAALAAWP